MTRLVARGRSTRSKFGNVKTQVGDHVFDSKAEARRYQDLLLLQKAGEIRDLSIQMPFPLHARTPEGRMVHVGDYRCDFNYYTRDGVRVIEDVKGGPTTALYRLKKKITEAQYGITISEVR